MNSQFKFKPDKIKYLSNIDTLDSSHKKVIDNIAKKRNEHPDKILKLNKLKKKLEDLDNKKNLFASIPNLISMRANLIKEISEIEDELNEIENYEEETEYYSKIYQILFNYYDILDGQEQFKGDCVIDDQRDLNDLTDLKTNNSENIQIIDKNLNDTVDENISNLVEINNNDAWNLDGVAIFEKLKSSKLDKLYEMSKIKRKEKKTTRKRFKNVESLIKDNNYNIFDYIHSNAKSEDNDNNSQKNDTLTYDVYDKAILYEDYKTSLEGYALKKNNLKLCLTCNVSKVLIYSEGIYACMKCGEIENCIIENEITNYKEPMVEKPTFPYKRKNHFCEWPTYILLVKVITKNNGYSLL